MAEVYVFAAGDFVFKRSELLELRPELAIRGRFPLSEFHAVNDNDQSGLR